MTLLRKVPEFHLILKGAHDGFVKTTMKSIGEVFFSSGTIFASEMM
jgi:hypothetical protein